MTAKAPQSGRERAAPPRVGGRFVRAAGITWHVQVEGAGPALLLLHGTGASTHSWRDLIPLLTPHFTVIAPDLPGHALTERPPRDLLSLFGMAAGVAALLRSLDVTPQLAAGHSAGAAILAQMSLDKRIAPDAIVGFNAALMPIGGFGAPIFSPLARVIARLPFLPDLLARRAIDRSLIEKMIADTGSKLTPEGIDHYWRLAQRPDHIAAAFGMMAEWDLPRFEKRLRSLATPLTLIVGDRDKTIPPRDASRVKALLPNTRIVTLEGFGHLAHEERPDLAASLILEVAGLSNGHDNGAEAA